MIKSSPLSQAPIPMLTRLMVSYLVLIALLLGVADAEAARKRPHAVHRTGIEPLKTASVPTNIRSKAISHPIAANVASIT